MNACFYNNCRSRDSNAKGIFGEDFVLKYNLERWHLAKSFVTLKEDKKKPLTDA